MGGICPSIHPGRYMYCTCTVPKGPLRASTFFFLDRVGELAAAAAEKVFWFFLYLFFGGGVFGTAAAAADGFYLALSFSLSLFLSFPGGRVWKRDWKRGKKGEKGSIRYISQRYDLLSASEREGEKEEEERGHLEKSEEKVLVFFCIYIFLCFIYIYILFSCI